jgi:ketosteroid isomerase-like protein
MRMRPFELGLAAMVALAALPTACGSAPAKPAAPSVEDAPADAAADVRGVVQEAYGSLGHGNREGILPLLADKIYAIGPAAGDAIQARTDVVVALTAMFPADKKHRMVSHALRAVVSPGGKSAYVTDQLDIDGAPYTAAAVMEQQGDLWVTTPLQVARPVAVARQGKDPLPPIVAQVDPGAKAVVDLFTQAAAVPDRFVEQLADGPEVVAIGAGPRDLLRGGATIHKAWKKALKKHPTFAVMGTVRAGVTPDGQLAWIHANVKRAADDADPVVHRAFYVYARDGASWRLTVAHESAVAPK